MPFDELTAWPLRRLCRQHTAKTASPTGGLSLRARPREERLKTAILGQPGSLGTTWRSWDNLAVLDKQCKLNTAEEQLVNPAAKEGEPAATARGPMRLDASPTIERPETALLPL